MTKIRFATMGEGAGVKTEMQLTDRDQDIHYIDVTTRLLDQELVAGTTHVGQPRTVSVSLDYSSTPKLQVEVQDYFTSEGSEWVCCWAVTNPVDGRLELFREESSHYALTRLPDPGTLIGWAESITAHQEKKVIGLHQSMDAFLLKYAKSEQDLPMVRMMELFTKRTEHLQK